VIIAFVVLLAVLATLALGTLVRWLVTGTDGRPRPVDPTYVKFPELYGSARMGLR
jgi:hypothetical protein